jgi:hypothetical protein
MACDICKKTHLNSNELMDNFSTDNVKHVCDKCLKDINNERSRILRSIPHYTKIFIESKVKHNNTESKNGFWMGFIKKLKDAWS